MATSRTVTVCGNERRRSGFSRRLCDMFDVYSGASPRGSPAAITRVLCFYCLRAQSTVESTDDCDRNSSAPRRLKFGSVIVEERFVVSRQIATKIPSASTRLSVKFYAGSEKVPWLRAADFDKKIGFDFITTLLLLLLSVSSCKTRMTDAFTGRGAVHIYTVVSQPLIILREPGGVSHDIGEL